MDTTEVLKELLEDNSTKQLQEDILIEEMSELTKAIMKYRRQSTEENYANIIEELVDVEVSMMSVKIFHLKDEKPFRKFKEHLKYKERYTIKCLSEIAEDKKLATGDNYTYCPHDNEVVNFVRVPKGDKDFPKGEDIGFVYCGKCAETVYPLTSGDFCHTELAKKKQEQYGYFELQVTKLVDDIRRCQKCQTTLERGKPRDEDFGAKEVWFCPQCGTIDEVIE